MATVHPVVENDYQEHLETYRGFLRGIRLSIAAAALVLLSLYFFLM